MKVKELVELLEASIFVCACITDIDCEKLEEKEFELADVGKIKTRTGSSNLMDKCFKVIRRKKTVLRFDTIDKLKDNIEIMEMEVISTRIHLSQSEEHNYSYGLENNSTFTFYVE